MVNKDWEKTQAAHVWVMRRHGNGNFTIGQYTVDLLCRGIQDTRFVFDTSEAECINEFGAAWKNCMAIEYNLAHNIIYAGYDFALGFDIPPHADFEFTRFILEEDDQVIPLIDVPVGANGIPHLKVEKSGQHETVLARLKQYAGEGNYYYTVTSEAADLDAHGDDAGMIRIADIPEGDINLGNVYSIHPDDMLDNAKVQQRSTEEQLILHAELMTRLLPSDIKGLPADVQLWDDMWEEMVNGAADPNNVPADHFDEYVQLAEGVSDLTALLDRNDAVMMKKFEDGLLSQVHQYAHSPLCMQLLYEHGVLLGADLVAYAAREYALKMYPKYPVLQCSLALGALIQHQPDDRFDTLYSQQDIRKALPGYEQYHALEIINFWLIKLWLSLDNNNIRDAVQYYYLLADTMANTWLLLPVLEKYVEVLYEYNMSLNGGVQEKLHQ
jgi:hypothetical protein